MPKKATPPDALADAFAMRAAGYTVLAISQHTGIAHRTLQRHFSAHGAAKGTIQADLLHRARNDLLARVSSNDAIREEAARLICDDLAHARHLRELMLEATEHLTATNLPEAALLMRAAAAYSTAIKNTSDMLRQSLRIDRTLDQASNDELPELIVCELSQTDVAALQKRNAMEAHDDETPMMAQ